MECVCPHSLGAHTGALFSAEGAQQHAGRGEYKGSANLPDAQHIDVRERIASVAAVCARNVSSVKTISEAAHPRLIAALREGTLTIDGAMGFCQLPKAEQLEQFIRHHEERENQQGDPAVCRSPIKNISPDAVTIPDAMQQQEAREPGSVVVRVGRLQGTVILVGRDLLSGPRSQRDLKVT
jgi:hypothetical protein